eukprot:SAG31_NODE_3829_length_3842_cov_124.370558_5_plen_91_part_00
MYGTNRESVTMCRMTPEVRASIARRAAVSARAAKSAKRAERLQVCSAMTKQSWARGMRAQSDVAFAAPARRYGLLLSFSFLCNYSRNTGL